MTSSTEDSDSNSSDKSDRQPLSNIEIDFSLEVGIVIRQTVFDLFSKTLMLVLC